MLVKFILDEGHANRLRLGASAFLASLGSVLLLVTVNLAAAEITAQSEDRVDWTLAVLFVVAAVMYYLAENDLIRQIGAAMEAAIDRMRMRLLDAIQRADYVAIERMGSASLYESITQATGALSQNSQFIALSIRSVVLTAMVLLYILYLSPLAFALVLASTAAVGVMYAKLGGRLAQRYAAMMGVERGLFQAVGDLFDGFKEIRLSSRRSDDLARSFDTISSRSTDIRIDVQRRAFQQLIFGHVAFFFLLAVVVFVVPTYSTGFASDVVKISAAVIFMIGPLGGVIQAVTVMASAEAAAQRVLDLDSRLAAMAEPGSDLPQDAVPADFTSISLSRVLYTYPTGADEQPFSVGPFDLEIRRGEVIFVTGGNGSGKSTFLKLLVGLYRPDHGHLAIDTQAVGDRTRRAYRELFAAVFTDSYLFRRLYGVPQVDADEARQLLAHFEMDRVTALDGDTFSHTDLSSGQRKRVMLVAALLARRPILILDEWAADQDPRFRRVFYRELIPELKARGITIIAVTHDDHYFDAADRRLHFDEGRMFEILPDGGA
jgi:putative ATP-binding cassette transporter